VWSRLWKRDPRGKPLFTQIEKWPSLPGDESWLMYAQLISVQDADVRFLPIIFVDEQLPSLTREGFARQIS